MEYIFKKYIDMISDAGYTTKLKSACTKNMDKSDELSKKIDNLKQMDLDPKYYFDLDI